VCVLINGGQERFLVTVSNRGRAPVEQLLDRLALRRLRNPGLGAGQSAEDDQRGS